MPRAFLAVLVSLLAAAAPARAQSLDELKTAGGAKPDAPPPPAPEGTAVDALTFPLTGCTDAQRPGVAAAVRGARAMVDSCLQSLNPKMAADIAAHFSKFDFACGQEPSGAGGRTTHEVDGRGRLLAAHITLTMRSRLVQYTKEARLFHEMIHAVDPPAGGQAKANRDGRYVISAARHAVAGFPDPVYGCQFACYGGIGEDEGKQMTRYVRLLKEDGLDIPESRKDFPCEGEACLHVKRYAYLCETGKPVVSKAILARDRKANLPTCVAEGLLNACGKADDASCASRTPPKGALCALRCETLLDAAANEGRLSGAVADKMFALGARLAEAAENEGASLSGEDAKVYAESGRIIAACR